MLMLLLTENTADGQTDTRAEQSTDGGHLTGEGRKHFHAANNGRTHVHPSQLYAFASCCEYTLG